MRHPDGARPSRSDGPAIVPLNSLALHTYKSCRHAFEYGVLYPDGGGEACYMEVAVRAVRWVLTTR